MALVFCTLLLCVTVAVADRVPLVTTAPVLGGVDVVAFHVSHSNTAVNGRSRFAANFSGFQFWFSSEENKEMFEADPWRFAPAYGGFSVLGVANEVAPGYKWSRTFMGPAVSVSAARILGGRLYFTAASAIKSNVPPTTIAKADARWAKWWGGAYTGPFNTLCFVEKSKTCIADGIDYSKHFDELDTKLLDPGYFTKPDFTTTPQKPEASKSGKHALLFAVVGSGLVLLCIIPAILMLIVQRLKQIKEYTYHTGEESPAEVLVSSDVELNPELGTDYEFPKNEELSSLSDSP